MEGLVYFDWCFYTVGSLHYKVDWVSVYLQDKPIKSYILPFPFCFVSSYFVFEGNLRGLMAGVLSLGR